MNSDAVQRIDKWLWFARFFRTRTLAARFVTGGKIRYQANGQMERITKPSHIVRPNDVLTFPLNRQIKVVRVLNAGTRRGPAPEAHLLYENLTPGNCDQLTLMRQSTTREPGKGRPTKKERRALFRFKGEAR
jgi:ribosome-associated heat shock protein Hsp15